MRLSNYIATQYFKSELHASPFHFEKIALKMFWYVSLFEMSQYESSRL